MPLALALPIPVAAVQIQAIDLIAEMLPLMALTLDPPGRGGSVGAAQAAAYATVAFVQFVNILSRRTPHSVFAGNLLANRSLLGALAVSLFVVSAIVNVPVVAAWFGFAPLRGLDLADRRRLYLPRGFRGAKAPSLEARAEPRQRVGAASRRIDVRGR